MLAQGISLKIYLPKIPNAELVALQGLDQMANYLGIPVERLGEAKIMIAEAVNNALEHAGDNNKQVRVEFKMNKEKLIIFVRDYGTGFDPSSIAEPDIKDKLHSLNKRGWGMKLMKSMADDFLIESKATGTKITLIKNL